MRADLRCRLSSLAIYDGSLRRVAAIALVDARPGGDAREDATTIPTIGVCTMSWDTVIVSAAQPLRLIAAWPSYRAGAGSRSPLLALPSSLRGLRYYASAELSSADSTGSFSELRHRARLSLGRSSARALALTGLLRLSPIDSDDVWEFRRLSSGALAPAARRGSLPRPPLRRCVRGVVAVAASASVEATRAFGDRSAADTLPRSDAPLSSVANEVLARCRRASCTSTARHGIARLGRSEAPAVALVADRTDAEHRRATPRSSPAARPSCIAQDAVVSSPPSPTAARAALSSLVDYDAFRGRYYHPQRSAETMSCHRRPPRRTDPAVDVGPQNPDAPRFPAPSPSPARTRGSTSSGYTSQAQRFLSTAGLGELLADSPAGAQLMLSARSRARYGGAFKSSPRRRVATFAPSGFASGDRATLLDNDDDSASVSSNG